MIDGSERGTAITAIVRSADGVRFVTTGACSEAVVSRLADYVRERCDDVLWSDAANCVRAMLDAGNPYAAIMLYFERVGERWDAEHLELVTFEHDDARWTSRNEIMADVR